jgi:hypothetical protein
MWSRPITITAKCAHKPSIFFGLSGRFSARFSKHFPHFVDSFNWGPSVCYKSSAYSGQHIMEPCLQWDSNPDRGLLAAGPGPRITALPVTGPGSSYNICVQAWFRWHPSNFIYNISCFLGRFFFRKEKFIHSCSYLMHVTQSVSGNKSQRLDFLWDVRIYLVAGIIRDNTSQTCIRYLCTVSETAIWLEMS